MVDNRDRAKLMNELDDFTLSYIEALLWSETAAPFDDCPSCGKQSVLCRWDKSNNPVCIDCSDRESNYEPPADENFSIDDLSDEALASIVEDCKDFQSANAESLRNVDYGISQWSTDQLAGHDFCLTRNGHGAGFWDRGLGKLGQALTDACKPYGTQNLYTGDDGKLYV